MDFNINPTTPNNITRDIVAFCFGIDATTSPIYVPVEPVNYVRFNYCLTDVPLYSQKEGGDTQFGWIIWECPNVFLQAEFHACWLNSENKLIDITPKPDNEDRILFLPDSQRTYEHKAVANRYYPLKDDEFTKLLLKLENKKEEIRCKHFKNDEVNSVAARAEFEDWLASFSSKA